MAGRIVDAAVTAGATDVTGPRFELADPRAAHRRAVSDAVADARRKARAMAKTAGVRLGPIVRIAEGSDGSVPRATGRDASEAGPPVEPGRIRVRARVTITFAAESA
jgi:uncharacterized protein YggE